MYKTLRQVFGMCSNEMECFGKRIGLDSARILLSILSVKTVTLRKTSIPFIKGNSYTNSVSLHVYKSEISTSNHWDPRSMNRIKPYLFVSFFLHTPCYLDCKDERDCSWLEVNTGGGDKLEKYCEQWKGKQAIQECRKTCKFC